MSRSVKLDTEEHPNCIDCGKCRTMPDQAWCWDCVYWSCERGEDCADASPEQELADDFDRNDHQ